MLLFIAALMSGQGAPPAAAAPIPTAVTSTTTPTGFQNPERQHLGVGALRAGTRAGEVDTQGGDAARRSQAHRAAWEMLWSIASDHLGAGDKYPQIAALNTDVLGQRPGFLQPGWVLDLPVGRQQGRSVEHTVTVQRGDTLSGIAQEELGDPSRYPEIFAVSQATTQPGGAQLVTPT